MTNWFSNCPVAAQVFPMALPFWDSSKGGFWHPVLQTAGTGDMSADRLHRFCTLILLASLATAWGVPCSARAVSVVTHSFATDTNDPAMPGCPVYDLKAEYKTDPTLVTSSIRSDTTRSHGQAWATAKITGSGLTKSLGHRLD